MPRKGPAPKRPLVNDPVYGSQLVTQLVNKVLLDGKKSLAERIVYGALEQARDKTGTDPVVTLKRALDNVKPALEVRSRRVGGATYQVPVEVRPDRSVTLALRWLVSFSKARREKTMVERLANEILDASNGLGAAVKRREDTHKMAEANRAFALERVHADVLRIPETDAHAIAAVLDGLEAGAGTGAVDGVAIMAPASPQVRDAIDRLRRRGVSVVAFISKQPNAERSRFIGIDNRAAGRTAARLMGRFCGPGAAGALLVVCETMQLLDNLERRLGFDQVINGVFPDLSVSPSLETWGDPERTRATLAQALANAPDLRGVYVMSSEADRVLDPLAEMVDLSRLVIVAHERTDYTEAALRAGAADAGAAVPQSTAP